MNREGAQKTVQKLSTAKKRVIHILLKVGFHVGTNVKVISRYCVRAFSGINILCLFHDSKGLPALNCFAK